MFIRNKKLIFCLLAMLAMVSTGSAQSVRTRFVNHTNKEGNKPKIGEFVDFHVDVYLGDTIFQTSRSTGKPARMQIPSPEQTGGRPMPAIFEGILLASQGDSISTYERIDSLTQPLPPAFYFQPEIRMDIVLVRIISRLDMEMQRVSEQREMERQRVQDSIANRGVISRVPSVTASVTKLAERLRNNDFGDELKTTPSGLQYVIFEKGKGAKIQLGEQGVSVHYYGCLLEDGTRFDDSFSRGEPYVLQVGIGQVIPGWDEGLMLLNHGAMALFKIPGDLAYGPLGGGPLIPANATLVFYVEVK